MLHLVGLACLHNTSVFHSAEPTVMGSFLEGCLPSLFGHWLVLRGLTKIEPRQRSTTHQA